MAIDLRDEYRRGTGVSFRLPPIRPQQLPTRPQQSKGESGTRVAPVPTPTPEQSAPQQESAGWRGIAGTLFNNPVAKAALAPLELIDTPRRAVNLAVEQYAMLAPEELEWLAPISKLVDEDKVGQDTRSNWEKFRDPAYGFGQITGDTGNVWVDRGIGLAGDIALDPLTYLTAGVGTAAGKANRATKLARLSEGIGRAEAFKGLGFADDALPKALRGLGTADDVERIGRRGLNVANDAQLSAMGIKGGQGLRFQMPFGSRTSAPIPGTRSIAKGINEAGGMAREQFKKLPGMERLRRTRHPIGFLGNDLGNAYERVLTGKGGGTIDEALEAIELDNMARAHGSRFLVPASDHVERMAEQLNKMTDAQVEELARQAEENGVQNILTETADWVRQAAADVGVDLPKLQGGEYAMPHVLTREARDHILALIGEQSPAASRFKQLTGITDNDLLEESGFLQRRRFRAGSEIPLPNGGKLTLEHGSIRELNEKLGELLPGFNGKIYETDPAAAYRRYLSGVSRDVAKRASFREAADRGFKGIFRQGATPDDVNPYVSRETMAVRTVDGEDVPLEQFEFVEPDLRGNMFFRFAPNERATKAVTKAVKQNHSALVKQYDMASEALRYDVAKRLEDVTDTLTDSIRNGLKASKAEVDFYRTRAATAIEEAGIAREAGEAAQRQIDEIGEQIQDLAKMRYGIKRSAASRTRSRQDAILQQVQDAYVQAERQLEEAQRWQAEIRAKAQNLRDSSELATRRQGKKLRQGALENADAKVRRFEKRVRDREAKLRETWRGTRGNRLPSQQEVDAGNRFLAENPQALRRYQRLEEIKLLSDREVFRVRDELAENNRYMRELFAKPNITDAENDLLTRLIERGDELNDELDKLIARRDSVAMELKNAEPMKMVDKALDDREWMREWENFRDSQMQSEKHALGQAIRERMEIQQALEREAVEAARPNLPPRYTPEQQAELDKARKYLSNNTNARRWQQAEEDLLDWQRAKAAHEAEGLKHAGQSFTNARRESAKARRWMAEHQQVGRNVERARNKIKQLEAIPEPTAPQVAPEPALAGVRQGEQKFAKQQAQEITQLDNAIPIADQKAAQAAQNLQEQRNRLGRIGAGVDEEVNQVALDEGGEAIRRSREVTDQQERLRLERQEYEAVKADVDEVLSALGKSYQENVTDLRSARAEHEAIKDRLTKDGKRIDYGLKGKLKARSESKPAGHALDDVAAGRIAPFEAQPLERTVRDLEEVIAANPTGNDPLMNRIEAELASAEQSLAKLTETDISAKQAQDILNAANKGELQPVMMALLRDEWKQLWDGGDVVIARDLEARYHRLRIAGEEPRKMGRLMTAYTNFFKTYATLSPGFHVRNGMSATFMNYSEGVSTATQFRGLKLWNQYAGAENPTEFLRSLPKAEQDAFTATFASGAGGRFFEAGVADPGGGAGRFKEAIFSNPLTRGSQRIGQDWVEGPVRLSLALHSIKQGENVTDALNRITRIHFDYSQISQFDEQARRFIPFWTFMSRNLPMQYTQIWTRPRTYNRYQSFVRNFSVEPAEYTPEYILEAGGFDTGMETPDAPGMVAGMPIFLQPDFAHSRLTEDFAKIENVLSGENPGQLLADFNPAITAPIEYATGRNLFTGRVYQDDDVRKASGPVDMTMLPLMIALNQAEKNSQGDWYYKEKGADALRSLNPILDRISRLAPETVGGESGDRQAEAILRFFGVPIRTVSDDQREAQRRSILFDERDAERLRRALEGSNS